MISPSGIKEAGKSIVEHSERAQAASTVESTALRSGLGEARRGLSRETNRLHGTSYKDIDRNLIVAFGRKNSACTLSKKSAWQSYANALRQNNKFWLVCAE